MMDVHCTAQNKLKLNSSSITHMTQINNTMLNQIIYSSKLGSVTTQVQWYNCTSMRPNMGLQL